MNDNQSSDSTLNHLQSMIINIFASPSEAISAIERKPSWLIPFLLIALTTAGFQFWYFSIVDYQWFTDQMIDQMSDVSEEQRQAITKAYKDMSSNVLAISGAVSATVAIIVLNLIQAAYLTLAAAISGSTYKFKYWFSLANWTGVVSLIATMIMAVNILLADSNQIDIYAINSLSFNSLGFNSEGNTSLKALYDTLNLLMFWTLALIVYGYRRWTGTGLLQAIIVVVLPHVLIFGTWLYIAVK